MEINVLVAARHACGDQFSGCVRANMRAQAGREGITLKSFGSGPDLYVRNSRPTLSGTSSKRKRENAQNLL